jgi:hypothetical protein
MRFFPIGGYTSSGRPSLLSALARTPKPVRRILRAVIPVQVKEAIIRRDQSRQAWNVVGHALGYTRSLVEHQCVDASGAPIPWYTYPAIEQLAKCYFCL